MQYSWHKSFIWCKPRLLLQAQSTTTWSQGLDAVMNELMGCQPEMEQLSQHNDIYSTSRSKTALCVFVCWGRGAVKLLSFSMERQRPYPLSHLGSPDFSEFYFRMRVSHTMLGSDLVTHRFVGETGCCLCGYPTENSFHILFECGAMEWSLAGTVWKCP